MKRPGTCRLSWSAVPVAGFDERSDALLTSLPAPTSVPAPPTHCAEWLVNPSMVLERSEGWTA